MKTKTFLLIALISLITVVGCKKEKEEEPQPAPPAGPVITNYVVKYKVRLLNGGSNSNMITYIGEGGNAVNVNDANDGQEFLVARKTGDAVYITGTNYSSGYSSIGIDIYTNDHLFKTGYANNSSGGSATAEAEGVLP